MAKRILLIGRGPPPDPEAEWDGFPTLRTWHFLRALLRAGHDVSLVSLEVEVKRGWEKRRCEDRTYACLRVPEVEADRADLPPKWLDASGAEIVVSAGPFLPAKCAAAMPFGPLVVIDLPGDPMAEAQMKAVDLGEDTPLAHSARVLFAALARGDRFTVISRRQHYALLGELALFGRMGKENVGIDPVLEVPIALETRWMESGADILGDIEHSTRKPALARAARVVWPGSLNTWADIDTFITACEYVCDIHPNLEVVISGGCVRHLTERRYEALRQRLQRSRHSNAFLLKGKVGVHELEHILRTSCVGVSLDLPCLEANLGSRTRLLHGLVCDLPWIVTPGTELADDFIAAGLARAVPHRDSDALRDALLDALEGRANGRNKAWEEARKTMLRKHDLEMVSDELMEYLRRPTPLAAPFPILGHLSARIQRLEQELASVYNTPTWRSLNRIHRVLNEVKRSFGKR